jgi:predicted kinase/8-oxo-dGTP pyrophosphatase MutT (NUDIX family)
VNRRTFPEPTSPQTPTNYDTVKNAASAVLPRLVVIAGPPCSGKTSLAKAIVARDPRFEHLDVDDVRERVLPASESTAPARQVAYATMHAKAERLLLDGRDVILTATYGPTIQREAATRLNARVTADFHLIECMVEPDDAVHRWRARGSHGANDLDVWKVRDLASRFNYFGGGCLLDTSRLGQPALEARAASEVSHRSRCSPDEWARDRSQLAAAAGGDPEAEAEKLSRRSMREAVNTLVWHLALVSVPAVLAVIGFVAFAGGSANAANDASVWLTAATLGALVFAVFDFLARPAVARAVRIRRAGSAPRYGPVRTVHRTNHELWHDYQSRLSPAARERMPIRGVPVYFVIPPRGSTAFKVEFEPGGAALSHHDLAEAAAREWEFDWKGYELWQRKRFAERFPRGGFTRAVRATSLASGQAEKSVRLTGTAIDYREYLMTEQASALEVPGQLPYMRYFFEGEGWLSRRWSDGDLEVAASAARYSMMLGVASLVITSDGFVVLQRRSSHVQAATGGVGASAAGSAEWQDVESGAPADALERAAHREIHEELGISSVTLSPKFTAPFLAAAYNFRYGRDLNFYAVFLTSLSRDEISEVVYSRTSVVERLRQGPRDRWEVAHIKFVRLSQVEEYGRDAHFLASVVATGRHVQGALYSLSTALQTR